MEQPLDEAMEQVRAFGNDPWERKLFSKLDQLNQDLMDATQRKAENLKNMQDAFKKQCEENKKDGSMNVDDIMEKLNLEEMASVILGQSVTKTTDVPEHDVPSLNIHDGSIGVRIGGHSFSPITATFPSMISVAATFDIDVARQYGNALAKEAHDNGVHAVITPSVTIHRHPQGGHNHHSCGEDPLLAGYMAAAVIKGLEEKRVYAVAKHFLNTGQERERDILDAEIDDKALREIYLKPFEIICRSETQPWAMLATCRSVNGTRCDANEWLLQKVLREEMKFRGLIMTRATGMSPLHDTINAGLDLEMPTEWTRRETRDVVDAVKAGKVTEDKAKERVRSVLNSLAYIKDRENLPGKFYQEFPDVKTVLKDIGARGMVLLKNHDETLPLKTPKGVQKTIAIIGYGKYALGHGGGTASYNAPWTIDPLDSLERHERAKSVTFTWSRGFRTERTLPSLTWRAGCGTVRNLNDDFGFTCRGYRTGDPVPAYVEHGIYESVCMPEGIFKGPGYTFEFLCNFTPRETGRHYMSCSGLGPTRVWVDDQLILEQGRSCPEPTAFYSKASPKEVAGRYPFAVGKTYRILIRTESIDGLNLAATGRRVAFRFGFQLESVHDADIKTEAVNLAERADYALVFTGHGLEYTTDGRDLESFDLPNGQNELVEAVASVNKKTIVFNSTGGPVALPWLDKVKTLVQAWYPGQQCGNSVADVVLGDAEPRGRLPMTWPKRVEDTPAHANFPSDATEGQTTVKHAEGLLIGYKHYDRQGGDANVLFPFGFGLSYKPACATFGSVKEQITEDVWAFGAQVFNNECKTDNLVVQVYVGAVNPRPGEPLKKLVAFKKVQLALEEYGLVRFIVKTRDVAYWDSERKLWALDKKAYRVSFGLSATDIIDTRFVHVERAKTWEG
ncbi:hypothetical protein N3K66_000848 [Trichothecium roseum]|uniref:Uncharacterized protein n=1 Tax=Trichothecium roseum TaxID=47278 RepID=A0ACC0VDN9_9HYPO|nr:hypothetical protein N3K66_000848 [Trichothecium roseum]